MKVYRPIIYFPLLVFVLIGFGCSSGGGESESAPPQVTLPQLVIIGDSLLEGDSGTRTAVFTVTLDTLLSEIVTVDYSTADKTAKAGIDYIAISGTLQFDPTQTSKTLTVVVSSDTDTEISETFNLALSNVSANAQLAISSAVGVIMNDDGQLLNDTGTTLCSDTTNNFLTCPQVGFPNQDSELGRDAQSATLEKTGAGRLGFDLTKLDANGLDLPATATTWSCLRDNVTGLIWEVKDITGSLTGIQSYDNTFTWYNPDNSTNGGNAGTPNGGNCSGGINCDTEGYVQAINQQQLCGYNDWRLPTQVELLSIYDYDTHSLDADYFPAGGATFFESWWSSVTQAFSVSSAHMLWTGTGGNGDSSGGKSHANGIRVVRSEI